MSFEEQLARGRTAEHLVSELLQERGWHIIPSYDFTGDDANKAPKLQGKLAHIVIPDLDAAKDGSRKWCEVKRKESANFTRITKRLEHGIPLRHYQDYQKVEEITGTEVWLFILEENTGDVLCAPLKKLRPRIYDGGKMSRGGMAFFARDHFHVFANIGEQLQDAS